MSIPSIWHHYASSDLDLPKDDSRHRQVFMINTISLIMILALTFYTFFNIFVTKLYMLAFIEMVVLIVAFIPIFILRKLQDINLASTILTINLFLLMVLFIYGQKNLDFGLAQAVFLPIVAIFLKGKKFGLIYSILFIAIILYIAFQGIGNWDPAPFTSTSFINLLTMYVIVIMFVYYFESSREEAFDFIKDAAKREHNNNLKLHEKSILLAHANEELTLYKNDLEAQVDKVLLEQKNQQEILIQQSKMAAMGEMISSIAHQWRQPLSVTAAIINNIKTHENLSEEPNQTYLDDMERIQTQLSFMNETITDFSNFLKPHKRSETFLVSKLLLDLEKIISPQMKLHNITFNINCTENEIEISNFKNELIQVILNIINNAQDAIIEKVSAQLMGKEIAYIKIEVSKKEDTTIISISDNAGGISDDILPNIFSPYFTTKTANKGTGIGLYMSQNIVEQSLGGLLSVRNGENGAVFTITL